MVKNMFKSPNILSKANKIKISPLKDYKHAENFGFIIVTQDELSLVCKTYPIFFAKDNESVLPIAILGLEKDKNSFLDDKYRWDEDCYIPSVIRCYPFGVATIGGKENEQESLSIAYDEAYDGLNQKDGKDMFNKDGELSEFGDKIRNFVQNTYASIHKTKLNLKLLSDLDLLKSVDVNIDKGSKKYKLQSMLQIDTDKLNTLKDNELLALIKGGTFSAIYAHTISLSNINAIANKL